MTTCCDAEGAILDHLHLFEVGVLKVECPDGSSIVEDRTTEHLIRKEESLFVLAPVGTGQGFEQ